MGEQFSTAIAALQEQLQKHERDIRETKRLINKLSVLEGASAPYPDAESETDSATNGAIRRDQFYGVPLATAIRKYLEMRRATSKGPATVSDIYAALMQGGFKFDAKNEANAKRGLYISLAKNSVTFHKLPGATDETAVFGLLDWYPNAKQAEEPKKKIKRVRLITTKKSSTSTRIRLKALPEGSQGNAEKE